MCVLLLQNVISWLILFYAMQEREKKQQYEINKEKLIFILQ